MSETTTMPETETIMTISDTAREERPPGLTESDFCGWLGAAAPGDSLEYHRGFLVLDTRPDSSRLAPADRAELGLVARRACWAAEHELVHLVQHRRGPCDFSYMAIARPWPDVPRSVLLAALVEELPE